MALNNDTLPNNTLEAPISDFSNAMDRYYNKAIYTQLEFAVATCIVFLQGLSVFHLLLNYKQASFLGVLIAIVIAYVAADFINGLVHMHLDNTNHYNSIIGPYISSFHMHHSTPKPGHRNFFSIYFFESKSKFWLLIYLVLLVFFQQQTNLNYSLNAGLVAFSILSTIAEVSHYWCHHSTSKNTIIQRLQKWNILLSKKHHAHHHRFDNTHYAFLNGMTNPILNKISKYLYKGYKENADRLVIAYLKSIQKTK